VGLENRKRSVPGKRWLRGAWGGVVCGTLVTASFLACVVMGIGTGSLPAVYRGAGGCGFSTSPGSRAARSYSSAASEVPCRYLWFTSAIT